MTSLALIGPQGSGKTTLARALGQYGWEHLSFADPLREIAACAYGPIDKAAHYEVRRSGATVEITGRELLQALGTDAIRRQLDEDFWVKSLVRRLAPGRHYVVDDCRFPNEERALREHGFRFIRLVGRAGPQRDHESEFHWPAFRYDATVDTSADTPEMAADRLVAVVDVLDVVHAGE
ncbi:MAG: hypothetical protein C0498_01455 [Anaerolinea sp.]|nr:hypothetical protein [Anaerolinea sp.]